MRYTHVEKGVWLGVEVWLGVPDCEEDALEEDDCVAVPLEEDVWEPDAEEDAEEEAVCDALEVWDAVWVALVVGCDVWVCVIVLLQREREWGKKGWGRKTEGVSVITHV